MADTVTLHRRRAAILAARTRGHAGPDAVVLSAGDAEGTLELARLDGRYPSTEVTGGFTGRRLAIGTATEPALVRSVTYVPGR